MALPHQSSAESPGAPQSAPRNDLQPARPQDSYGQILRSSSIIGGAQGINYIIGMVRTKLVAVLLGPSGVGLVGLYVSVTELIGTLAGLGISQSGVRQVAEAHGSGDPQQVARTVKTLRRICWLTGLLGWVLTAVLSYPLSVWAFGTPERAWAIALLGGGVFLGAVTGGRTALIQGTRRIGDLARLNVLTAVTGTVVAVSLYAWLGESGIVPVLLVTAAINLGGAWWFAQRVAIYPVSQSWRETFSLSRKLVGFGIVFMCSALAGSVVALGIRAIIVRELGVEANGIYQAAWAISGMFGNFVVAAMGTDFYPKLTAVAGDSEAASSLVNEQTEVGIMVALPGLLATMLFAPWFIHLFFSAKFAAGSELLPWFILSVFCRMVSYPVGYILLAKRASRRYLAITVAFHVLDFTCCALLIPMAGLLGIAVANAILCLIYPFGMKLLAGPLIAFKWTAATRRLMLISCLWMLSGMLCIWLLPPGWVDLAGLSLVTGAGVFALRGLAHRLGASHRLVALVCRMPGGRFACGL